MRNPMFSRMKYSAALLAAAAMGLTAMFAKSDKAAGVADNAIWVDGVIYGTVGTSTSFKSPPEHSTDVIYSFTTTEEDPDFGLDGQRSIAEAAPGDTDYNGGRWSVKKVVYTDAGLAFFDANNDGVVDDGFELMSDEELHDAEDLGLVVITDTGIYFECPLRPRHNQ